VKSSSCSVLDLDSLIQTERICLSCDMSLATKEEEEFNSISRSFLSLSLIEDEFKEQELINAQLEKGPRKS
jgi:hypothetical protein